MNKKAIPHWKQQARQRNRQQLVLNAVQLFGQTELEGIAKYAGIGLFQTRLLVRCLVASGRLEIV